MTPRGAVLHVDVANLFPQDANFNTGAFKTFENEVADWIEAGAQVRVKVDLGYDNDGLRPSDVKAKFTVHDLATGKRVRRGEGSFANETAQTFDRSSREFVEQTAAG